MPDDASEDNSAGYRGCQRSPGKDASLATKDVSQRREWADTSATRARMPAQGKRYQQDAGSGASGGKREASAIMAMTREQWRQRLEGRHCQWVEASATRAMTPARRSDGTSEWRATTPMQCWHGASAMQVRTSAHAKKGASSATTMCPERLCNGAEASATGAMTPARGGQRCQRAIRASMPA